MSQWEGSLLAHQTVHSLCKLNAPLRFYSPIISRFSFSSEWWVITWFTWKSFDDSFPSIYRIIRRVDSHRERNDPRLIRETRIGSIFDFTLVRSEFTGQKSVDCDVQITPSQTCTSLVIPWRIIKRIKRAWNFVFYRRLFRYKINFNRRIVFYWISFTSDCYKLSYQEGFKSKKYRWSNIRPTHLNYK